MKVVRWSLLAALTIGLLLVVRLYLLYGRNAAPVRFSDPVEHFKFGSIGGEVDGYPFLVWRTLPELFPERVSPDWSNFGFISEPGRDLPVGISVRQYGVPRVGFNCATCHTSTVNGGSVVLGAPANKVDLVAYLQFLIESSKDRRFTADTILAIASRQDPAPGWLDRLVYRWYVIPKLVSTLAEVEGNNRWRDSRPPAGPGRTDAGNPWRVHFGMHPERDRLVGTVDFPAFWNQQIRANSWLHWDGNNRSLSERNLSAALAGGATEKSLDHRSIERVADWSLTTPPPAYPFRVDHALARAGGSLYRKQQCGSCHDPGGTGYGGTTPMAQIGTDPHRFELFSEALLKNFGSVGRGRPWQFRNYRKSNGYANLPLDGLWMRAPYLHNGSVPTLADLLSPPSERPARFLRGCDTFDSIRVGFMCKSGTELRTDLPGNGSGGHVFGTELPPADKRALLEYLKTK